MKKQALSASLLALTLTGCALDEQLGSDEAALEIGPSNPPLEQTTSSVVSNAVGLAGSGSTRRYVGISVAVIRDGVRSQYHFGEAIKGSGTKPTSNTLYAIGSVTKTFTATLLAIYDRENVANFEDTLDSHTSWTLPTARQSITLEDLATHHSGLPEQPPGGLERYQTGSYTGDMNELMGSLDECPTGGCSSPIPNATNDSYSNYGYAVLAHVLSKKAPYSSVQAALSAKVLNPLDMTSTNNKANLTESQCTAYCPYSYYGEGCVYSPTCNLNFSPRAAIGYLSDWSRDPDEGSDDNVKAGSGVLWSTSSDMLKWLAYNMDSNSGAPWSMRAVLDELHQVRAADNMGLAWRLVQTPDGRDVWSKSGKMPQESFHAYISFIPGSDEGVVVMANSPISDASVSVIARNILDGIAD